MTIQTTAFLSLILQCLPQINIYFKINKRSPQLTLTQMSNASEPISQHEQSSVQSKTFPENNNDHSNVLSTSLTDISTLKSPIPSLSCPSPLPSSPNLKNDKPDQSDLQSLLEYQSLDNQSPILFNPPWREISITPEIPSDAELTSLAPSPRELNLCSQMRSQGISYRIKIPEPMMTELQIFFIPMYNQLKQGAINVATHSAAPLTMNNNPYKSKETEMLIEIDPEMQKAVKGYNLTHNHVQAYDLRQTKMYENIHSVLIWLFEPCQTCIPTFKQFILSAIFLIDDSLISSRAPWTKLKAILNLGKECWMKQELEELSKCMLIDALEIDKHAEAVEEEAHFPHLILALADQMEQREVETHLFLSPLLIHKLKKLRTQINEALAIYYDTEWFKLPSNSLPPLFPFLHQFQIPLQSMSLLRTLGIELS